MTSAPAIRRWARVLVVAHVHVRRGPGAPLRHAGTPLRAPRRPRPAPPAARPRCTSCGRADSTRSRPFWTVRRLTTVSSSGASRPVEAQLALQRRLAGGLACQAARRCRAGRVACRWPGSTPPSSTPLRMPEHRRAALTDHAVQAAAELVRGDLARVGRAHRGDPVGKVQARLHERQLAVELQPRRATCRRSQAQHGPVVAETGPGKARLCTVKTVRPGCAGCAAR